MKGRVLAAVGGAAAAVVLAGCVNLPPPGTPYNAGQLPDSAGTMQQGIQLDPIPPGTQWQPEQIVRGFLSATGATWNGHQSSLSVARQYLTGGFARHWRPTPAATVIDTAPALTVQSQILPHVTGGQAAAQVAVTSQHLATLVSGNAQEAGSIQVSSQPKPYVYDFDLVQVGGKWRIASISGPGIPTTKPGQPDDDSILLLENSDFERDYQPRNLYFPAVSAPHTLVPFPVYILDQSGSLGVQSLVEGLTSPPPTNSNWLYRSVTTAFKPDTKLTTLVQAHSNQAIVDLDGKAARVGPQTLTQMEAQLFWTLTSSPYSTSSGIQSVMFQVGSKSVPLLPSRFASWVPGQAAGSVYFQTLDAEGYPQFNRESTTEATNPPKKGTPAYAAEIKSLKLGPGPLTAVAVSPPSRGDSFRAPIFAGCRARTKEVYVAELGVPSTVTTQQISAGCTSLSWDSNGYLWVGAGSSVFRIKVSAEGLTTVPITIPAQQLAPPDNVTALKVAPDGVRVAMIITHHQGSASVVVTSISQKTKWLIYLAQNEHFLTVGPELTDPISLSWWGPDHLLVLDKKADGAYLYEVPLNGGQSTLVPNVPLDTVAVAGNGSSLAIQTPGASGPEVRVSRELGGIWHRIPGASSPTYPG